MEIGKYYYMCQRGGLENKKMVGTEFIFEVTGIKGRTAAASSISRYQTPWTAVSYSDNFVTIDGQGFDFREATREEILILNPHYKEKEREYFPIY